MHLDIIWSIMEHIGVIAFAISGAVVAIDRETDIFGVVFASFITSFGGGIMRDLLLGCPGDSGTPLFFTSSYLSLIIVCLVASLAVFFFAVMFKRSFLEDQKKLDYINNYIDAVGIGAFTVSGARLAIEAGHSNPFIAIIMGMIACIGGGMLRDIMFNDIPFVLRKRIYALAAAAGAGVYCLIRMLGPDAEISAMVVGALTTVLIRVLATIFRWNMPKAINFTKLREEQEKTQQILEQTEIKENNEICK